MKKFEDENVIESKIHCEICEKLCPLKIPHNSFFIISYYNSHVEALLIGAVESRTLYAIDV